MGTLLRYGVALSVPTPAGLAVTSLGATLTVNITGSLLLAALLQCLTGRSETAVMRRSRLALGTGVISGYTTYSTLAVEVQQLLVGGHEVTALAYVVITVLGGFAAAAAGASIARAVAGAAGGASELESEEGQP